MSKMSLANPWRSAAVFVLLSGLALAGCGFHLRGSGEDASFAQRLYLDGPAARTGFRGVFETALSYVGGSVVGSPEESTGIVYLYNATFRRQPVTLSSTGRATGFDLSYRVVYEVRSPKGVVLQPRKEFELKRDYYNDQTLPLAQQSEEGQINEALANEAAQSLLLRVVYQLKKTSESAASPEKKL